MKDLIKRLEESKKDRKRHARQYSKHLGDAAFNVKKRTGEAIVEASAAGAKATLESLEWMGFTVVRGDGAKVHGVIEDLLKKIINTGRYNA